MYYDADVVSLLESEVEVMAILERPSLEQIDQAVRSVLESGEPIDFPELETTVKERLPKLRNQMLVRQSVWRLINANYAEVVPGMRVRKRVKR